MVVVDRQKCRGCQVCASVCPVGAISFDNNVAVIDSSLCRGCLRCARECPAGAIYRQ